MLWNTNQNGRLQLYILSILSIEVKDWNKWNERYLFDAVSIFSIEPLVNSILTPV